MNSQLRRVGWLVLVLATACGDSSSDDGSGGAGQGPAGPGVGPGPTSTGSTTDATGTTTGGQGGQGGDMGPTQCDASATHAELINASTTAVSIVQAERVGIWNEGDALPALP